MRRMDLGPLFYGRGMSSRPGRQFGACNLEPSMQQRSIERGKTVSMVRLYRLQ